MALSTPDWLSKHGGQLRLNYEGSWVVCFDNEPQYRLRPVPAAGKFACEVEQLNNGRRLDGAAIYPTAEEAVRGGLEELRKTLGW